MSVSHYEDVTSSTTRTEAEVQVQLCVRKATIQHRCLRQTGTCNSIYLSTSTATVASQTAVQEFTPGHLLQTANHPNRYKRICQNMNRRKDYCKMLYSITTVINIAKC